MTNKPFIFILLIMMGAAGASGQEAPYRWATGCNVGMSGYLGDANASLMQHPGVTAFATMRYMPTVRWAFRGDLGVSTLSGDTRDIANVMPQSQQFDFHSTLFALDAMAEFNFMPYGIGRKYQRLSRFTPYLALGIGFALSKCGNTTDFAPAIPMGVGVKYKVSTKLNLMAEFVMTKVFSDRVDGILLEDPLSIKSSFMKNTDWYSRLSIGFSYEWGERCLTCHYKD